MAPLVLDTFAVRSSGIAMAEPSATQIRHIVLLGPMAAGKSTIGAVVAVRLGWPLVDSDTELEAATGMDGRHFALRRGVAALHTLEQEIAARALAADHPVVLAAAASVVDDDALVRVLRGHCCVWLHAPATVLADRRRQQAHRRRVNEAELTRLQGRDTIFGTLAEVAIDTAVTAVDEAVDRIVSRCGSSE